MELCCQGFCMEPLNTPFGLVSVPIDSVKGEDYYKVFALGHIPQYGPRCPVGYTQFPTTIEKTHTLIKANGRHTICPRNPWKWDRV